MNKEANIHIIMTTARSVSFEIEDGSIVNTDNEYEIFINDNYISTTQKVVNSIYDLEPGREYRLRVVRSNVVKQNNRAKDDVEDIAGGKGLNLKNSCEVKETGVSAEEKVCLEASFTTDEELLTLNVMDLGAHGDGIHDDTAFIQAAIMACPQGGRVLIPEGKYKITSIFLKSHLRLEIGRGAHLLADTERANRVHFPGAVKTTNPANDEYHLGTWEGDPFPMFAGIITGINAEDIIIYGEGKVDGCASAENWWKDPKKMVVAYRPRMLFLNNCKDVKVQGVTLTNSPAWVIHPFFSRDLLFCDLFVNNPKLSPNTDGLDPESCDNVDIVGVHFSLGDDCIAIKSGKIYMGSKYKKPSDNIHIWQCFMENGHGAVTLGSEIAGGVTNVLVEKCRFERTDRGLRIKTRRGRGKQCFLNNIKFENIVMNRVMNPFTANMFYFCDPDGHEEYVQSRAAYPVDERTPKLGILEFENIKAVNAQVSAAYFDGLPESKIEAVIMRNVDISFSKETETGVPIMCDSVKPMTKKGIYAGNVSKLVLDNVSVTGYEGEKTEFINVDDVEVN